MEQRKHQRFELRLPLEIAGAGPTKTQGLTKNVSSSGVLFTATAPVPIGEPIEYVIAFPPTPDGRANVSLRCIGKVLRKEPDSGFAATLERYEFVRQPTMD